MIIALCGFNGAGKNTVGEILVDNHDFTPLSFAKPLKRVLSTIFGWKYNLLEGDTAESRVFRETVDKKWSNRLGYTVTPRIMMQKIGTSLFRDNFFEDVWVDCLERELDTYRKHGYSNFVVTDLRFTNEFDFLATQQTKFVQVLSPKCTPPWYYTLVNEPEKIKDLGIHESEYLWYNNAHIQYTINNDSTKESLAEQINSILR